MSRTQYDKLQAIISICNEKPRLPIDQLAEEVRRRKPDAFKVFSYASGKQNITYCKIATIKQSIRLLIDLQLLKSEADCSLTNNGRNALKNLEGILEQAVLNYLDRAHGLSFESVRKEIHAIKSSETNDVPSARDIHAGLLDKNAFSNPIGVERFVRLMSVLGRCGLLSSNFRKFYWVSP
jgi:hypothetical protein